MENKHDKNMKDINYWIKNLDLKPHPEGGYFKEVFRSEGKIPKACSHNRFGGDRSYMTSVYFLLSHDDFSAFHQFKQDEIWNFHYGSSICLHTIDTDGSYTKFKCGLDIKNGDNIQCMVKAGQWFCATVEEENGFAVVGCVVAPGFDFADFELGHTKQLLEKFPQHKEIIKKYSRE